MYEEILNASGYYQPPVCGEEIESRQQCDYSNDYYFESEMFYYADQNVWVAKRFKDKWKEFMKKEMLTEDYELLTKKIDKQLISK